MVESDSGTPGTGFGGAAQWGLASLVIGCTLLLAACATLVFNVLLFRTGPAGIETGPMDGDVGDENSAAHCVCRRGCGGRSVVGVGGQ